MKVIISSSYSLGILKLKLIDNENDDKHGRTYVSLAMSLNKTPRKYICTPSYGPEQNP